MVEIDFNEFIVTSLPSAVFQLRLEALCRSETLPASCMLEISPSQDLVIIHDLPGQTDPSVVSWKARMALSTIRPILLRLLAHKAKCTCEKQSSE